MPPRGPLRWQGSSFSSAPASPHIANPFPSLVISATEITASGSFAETQATYLNPDKDLVKELDLLLRKKRVGLVAHYYMDPELQGTLASLSWPHVFVADSLAMGEAAAKMAATGEIDAIICMGVDFMSESVRATLDSNVMNQQDGGKEGGRTAPPIPVYRLSEHKIGCSLAEAAERQAYSAFLEKASRGPPSLPPSLPPAPSLHVVYINTSLVTKALSHEILPTITCTSSNVLATLLSAYAQIPNLHVYYGPDTYMGANLEALLQRLAALPPSLPSSLEMVRKLHPAHTPDTIKDLLPRFHYFKQGNCVVHHLFGAEVTERVRTGYPQAYHTAHLEVPGEMFALAMEAAGEGRGVVGSTSNILSFILDKTKEAVRKGGREGGRKRLQFVLGTEAGMVTSIVRGVEKLLKEGEGGSEGGVEVEIIFPVAAEAISQTGEGGKEGGLGVVPGVKGGEGCSTAGGCATCPYMKMNSLDALVDVLERCPESSGSGSREIPASLLPYLPPKREVQLRSGKSLGEVGAMPIVHMRALMKEGRLSEALVQDVLGRAGGRKEG